MSKYKKSFFFFFYYNFQEKNIALIFLSEYVYLNWSCLLKMQFSIDA